MASPLDALAMAAASVSGASSRGGDEHVEATIDLHVAKSSTKKSSTTVNQRTLIRPQHTKYQKAVMLSYYMFNKLPDVREREAIAKSIGLTARAVQIWFQNRRQRQKVTSSESHDDDVNWLAMADVTTPSSVSEDSSELGGREAPYKSHHVSTHEKARALAEALAHGVTVNGSRPQLPLDDIDEKTDENIDEIDDEISVPPSPSSSTAPSTKAPSPVPESAGINVQQRSPTLDHRKVVNVSRLETAKLVTLDVHNHQYFMKAINEPRPQPVLVEALPNNAHAPSPSCDEKKTVTATTQQHTALLDINRNRTPTLLSASSVANPATEPVVIPVATPAAEPVAAGQSSHAHHAINCLAVVAVDQLPQPPNSNLRNETVVSVNRSSGTLPKASNSSEPWRPAVGAATTSEVRPKWRCVATLDAPKPSPSTVPSTVPTTSYSTVPTTSYSTVPTTSYSTPMAAPPSAMPRATSGVVPAADAQPMTERERMLFARLVELEQREKARSSQLQQAAGKRTWEWVGDGGKHSGMQPAGKAQKVGQAAPASTSSKALAKASAKASAKALAQAIADAQATAHSSDAVSQSPAALTAH